MKKLLASIMFLFVVFSGFSQEATPAPKLTPDQTYLSFIADQLNHFLPTPVSPQIALIGVSVEGNQFIFEYGLNLPLLVTNDEGKTAEKNFYAERLKNLQNDMKNNDLLEFCATKGFDEVFQFWDLDGAKGEAFVITSAQLLAAGKRNQVDLNPGDNKTL